jgi:hypothetical protein
MFHANPAIGNDWRFNQRLMSKSLYTNRCQLIPERLPAVGITASIKHSKLRRARWQLATKNYTSCQAEGRAAISGIGHFFRTRHSAGTESIERQAAERDTVREHSAPKSGVAKQRVSRTSQ